LNDCKSENDGICYIETKNLDGETCLKYKQCQNDISSLYAEEEEIINIRGIIDCEQPNEFIYEFNAKMFLIQKNSFTTIDKNNFILRGCSLKQTCFIYGIAVYIGHNSKIMKNSPSARSKTSKLESYMNFQIITVFLIQFTLSVLGATLFLIWHSNKDVK
jgi:magnesium-transporting ATPase (P-type)